MKPVMPENEDLADGQLTRSQANKVLRDGFSKLQKQMKFSRKKEFKLADLVKFIKENTYTEKQKEE